MFLIFWVYPDLVSGGNDLISGGNELVSGGDDLIRGGYELRQEFTIL